MSISVKLNSPDPELVTSIERLTIEMPKASVTEGSTRRSGDRSSLIPSISSNITNGSSPFAEFPAYPLRLISNVPSPSASNVIVW